VVGVTKDIAMGDRVEGRRLFCLEPTALPGDFDFRNVGIFQVGGLTEDIVNVDVGQIDGKAILVGTFIVSIPHEFSQESN
jgi:hypothetical protein